MLDYLLVLGVFCLLMLILIHGQLVRLRNDLKKVAEGIETRQKANNYVTSRMAEALSGNVEVTRE